MAALDADWLTADRSAYEMKFFQGKWRLKVKAKDGKVLSLSYKGETNPPTENDVLIFYLWEDQQRHWDILVIQSQVTGKYLRLKEPLDTAWVNKNPCFTAFEATGEFDTAFPFGFYESRGPVTYGLDLLPSTLPADDVDARGRPRRIIERVIGVQRESGGDSIQLGLVARGDPLHWDTHPCARNRSERYTFIDDLNIVLENVTPALNQIQRRGPNDECYLDLTGVDLRELSITPFFAFLNLKNADLRGADLTGAILHNTELKNADLRGADLTGAIFDGAILSAAKMSSCNLSKADLTAAKYDTPPVLRGTEANLTSLKGATVPLSLLGKDWSYLNLDGATIMGINARQDLKKLKACHADLSNLDLSGLALDEADFSHATIINTTFTGSTLTNAHFDDAKLYNTKFISCNLEGASFQKAQMGGVEGQAAADFSYAYLANVDLSGANLYAATMIGVTMFGGQTRIGNKAILDLVNLVNAYLVEVSFKDLNMRGASLDNSCLIAADFSGSNLSSFEAKRSTLTRACLQGANFTNAKLDEATFDSAAISFDKGQLLVQYRDENGKITEEMPHHYKKTSGLEEALPRSMICPNGKTVDQNKKQKISQKEMLTARDEPTKWVAPDR